MKYLSNYTEEAQTKALNENGAFFAFSNEQLNKQKKKDIKYTSLGYGLIVPIENVNSIINALDKIHEEGIKADKADHTKKEIIWRELANHEAHIVNSTADTIDALKDYNYSETDIKEVYKEYFNYCVEHDIF